MIKHPVWRKLLGFVFVAVAAVSIAADESSTPAPDAEIHGPNVRPGYPDAFALGYKLAEDSRSPDGKYGAIYADNPLLAEREVARNFLIALKVGTGSARTTETRTTGVADPARRRRRCLCESTWGPFGELALLEGKALSTEARVADLEKRLKL